MEFRPCIDIHNGKVKQIVGGSLKDAGDFAEENFVTEKSAADFARLYKRKGLCGGHIILLNAVESEYYAATKKQALAALAAYPGGMQVGGGMTADNAGEFLSAGASHVIVTSWVFAGGLIHYDRLEQLRETVGKERLVLDVSCRRRGNDYYVVTDRWQRWTTCRVTHEFLDKLAEYADEFLIHAVDVEGRTQGIERPLVELLGSWQGIPVTYAGGVADFADLEALRELGQGRVNVTVGSALDLFGGDMDFEKVLTCCGVGGMR